MVSDGSKKIDGVYGKILKIHEKLGVGAAMWSYNGGVRTSVDGWVCRCFLAAKN
jgi:hypothetical protein